MQKRDTYIVGRNPRYNNLALYRCVRKKAFVNYPCLFDRQRFAYQKPNSEQHGALASHLEDEELYNVEVEISTIVPNSLLGSGMIFIPLLSIDKWSEEKRSEK